MLFCTPVAIGDPACRGLAFSDWGDDPEEEGDTRVRPEAELCESPKP